MNRKELSQQFAEKLEIERTSLNLTQKQMAEKLDLSLSAYKRIITCDTDKIDLYLIYRLYLLTGKLAYEFTDYTNDMLDLKRKIRGLSPSQLAYISGLVDFEIEFSNQNDDFEDYITVYIPTGNMEDGMIYDSANVKKINIKDYRRKYRKQISCAVQVTSNHMHPVYNKGDILLISRSPVRDGDTGVFFNKENGCAYIRKFYQTSPCTLVPVNGYGETFTVNSEREDEMGKWIKFGIIIAKMR